MICDHPWISSSIVKHWGGSWIEYRCANCGTGIYQVKQDPFFGFYDPEFSIIEMNRRRDYQRKISKEIAELFKKSRHRSRILIMTTPNPPDDRIRRILKK